MKAPHPLPNPSLSVRLRPCSSCLSPSSPDTLPPRHESHRAPGPGPGSADQLRDHPAHARRRRQGTAGADRRPGQVPSAVHRHHEPRGGGHLRRDARGHPAPGEAQAAGHPRSLRADPEQIPHRRRAPHPLPGLHSRGDRGFPDRASLPGDRQRPRRAGRRQRLPEAPPVRPQRQPLRLRPGESDRRHEPRPLLEKPTSWTPSPPASASASAATPKSTSKRPTCGSTPAT